MAQRNANGELIDPNDQYPLDPATSRNALANGVSDTGRQGITDPSFSGGEQWAPAGATPTTAGTTGPSPYNPATGQTANLGSAGPTFTNTSTVPQGVTGAAGSFQAGAPNDPSSPTAMIDALYKQYGISDGGRGSGFADRAYWLEHPSEIANGRLGADLAGTGSDQPTGTPGSGPWQNSGKNALAGAGPAGGVAGVPSAPSVPSAPAAVSMPATDPAVSQFNQQMRDMLMKQLGDLGAPETADSADIQPAISAFNNQSTRDQQAERDQLAERFYASGGGTNSGAFNTAVQQGAETAAGNRANFVGSTVQQANTARRAQLTTLLNTAVTAGDTQSAQEIQKQIAQIDANLRQQGITNQNTQFNQSLSQQDQQYYDALDKQYADLAAQQNRDALIYGLNG